MKLALKNLLTKALIALIALQIINLGIDAVEFQPLQCSSAIGEFNYFNSMTEYISEILLNHKDAFPEFQQSAASSNARVIKHLSIKIFGNSFDKTITNFAVCKLPFIVPIKEKYEYLYSNEINPPPPKLS